jgi:hypothetical protein
MRDNLYIVVSFASSRHRAITRASLAPVNSQSLTRAGPSVLFEPTRRNDVGVLMLVDSVGRTRLIAPWSRHGA